MLILKIKPGGKVYINGEQVVVEVLEIDGNAARIGFTAPPDITINRDDVHEKIIRGVPRPKKKGNRS